MMPAEVLLQYTTMEYVFMFIFYSIFYLSAQITSKKYCADEIQKKS